MKLIRYRKPSVKTALGITKAKKRINKKSGLTAIRKPSRALSNAKRKAKRRTGYYSAPAKLIRTKKPPTPLGCLLPVLTLILFVSILISL